MAFFPLRTSSITLESTASSYRPIRTQEVQSMLEKLGGHVPSELEMAAAIVRAFLRLSDTDKEKVIGVALKARAPEIRVALFRSASISGLAVPEEFEAEAAEILDRHDEDAGKRSLRGQKIAEGHRRRREAGAELKGALAVDAGLAASKPAGVGDRVSAVSLPSPPVIDGPLAAPVPPSAARPAPVGTSTPTATGPVFGPARPPAAHGLSPLATASRPLPSASTSVQAWPAPAPGKGDDHRG